MHKVKSLFFALLIASTLSFAGPIVERKIDLVQVESLMKLTHLEPSGDVIEQTQAHWLRGKQQEYWDILENHQHRDQIISWGKQNHIYEEWLPSKDHYDQALILGATCGRMESRLNFLIDLFKEGVRFKKVVWLCGERPLNPQVDHLYETCLTEAEAAESIWRTTDMPQEMKNLQVEFVRSEMREVDGRPKRPSTHETLIDWRKQNQGKVSGLFISNQPYCIYQYAAIERAFKEDPGVDYELVGESVDPSKHTKIGGLTLDIIARWLFTRERPHQ